MERSSFRHHSRFCSGPFRLRTAPRGSAGEPAARTTRSAGARGSELGRAQPSLMALLDDVLAFACCSLLVLRVAQDSGGTARRHGPGRPFAKGQSGNPGGRPKGLVRAIREQTRDRDELVAFMLHFRGEATGVRLREPARGRMGRPSGHPPSGRDRARRVTRGGVEFPRREQPRATGAHRRSALHHRRREALRHQQRRRAHARSSRALKGLRAPRRATRTEGVRPRDRREVRGRANGASNAPTADVLLLRAFRPAPRAEAGYPVDARVLPPAAVLHPAEHAIVRRIRVA